MLTIGSLFSGIGGLELGLEWAGLGPVLWQVEKDPFCRAVLAKHWPDVERFDDVTTHREYTPVDLICGGFPCQDVSSAGKRRGLAGERSGLWFEFARVIGEVRPRVVVVENVASGARRWLPQVRRDLCALGYRSVAYSLSAAAVGAPHLRRRIFVVADAYGVRGQARIQHRSTARTQRGAFAKGDAAQKSATPDADGAELRGESRRLSGTNGAGALESQYAGWRSAQPDVVRVVHGVSRRLDACRRRVLGNAVVPQCAEVIGRMIRRALEEGEGER